MLVATLQRYRCTLAEVREDYWLGRAWRALSADPALAGRVARVGLGNILITGEDFGPASRNPRERELVRQMVVERLITDTGRTPGALGLSVLHAQTRPTLGAHFMQSLISQVVATDVRWEDLSRYAADLSPVIAPVAHIAEAFVAA